MSVKIAPTKGNLLAEKKKLALAETGFGLMDQKRAVLLREMTALIDRIRELQKETEQTFHAAYKALQKANLLTGIRPDLAASVPIDESAEIKTRSVMGVEIPTVVCDRTIPSVPPYGLGDSNSALDDAYLKFLEVKHLCAQIAQIESSVFRLADAIKKTQKRANALRNVIIPSSEETVREITAVLEEREREEFSRMKVVKRRKQSENDPN